MKKYIVIDNIKTHFLITTEGQVINSLTGTILKGTIRDGYRYYDLRFNGKKKSKSGHRLVAEHFLENPNGYEVVHHKNGNRLDNSVDNLEWVSYSINNLSINKKVGSSNNEESASYFLNKEEIWKNYKNTIYSISSCGRVRNNSTNKILKGKITINGYREYCLTIDRKKKSYLGHRLVYSTFHPFEEIDTINHIDGNKLNNCIDNLENVSSKENNLKAIYETKSKKFKTVGQFDKEGNLINVYITCVEASRAMNCTPQSINAAIHNNYCSCGYYWKYLEY